MVKTFGSPLLIPLHLSARISSKCESRVKQAAERFTGYATADVRRSFYGDVFLDRADGEQEAVKFPLSSDAGPVVKETWVSRTGERRTTLWSHALFHDHSRQVTHVLLAVSPGSREHQASGY